jgi:hypothetical protein
MKIKINIEKKHFYLAAALFIFLAGVSFAIAYNPLGSGSNFAVNGHQIGEIDFSQKVSQIKATEVCLAGTCQTAWPSGGGTGYGAGTGLTLSGQTLSLKTPSSSQIGGVRASLCPAGQKAMGIDSTGKLICNSEPVVTYTATCSGSGSCYATCSPGDVITGIVSQQGSVFVGASGPTVDTGPDPNFKIRFPYYYYQNQIYFNSDPIHIITGIAPNTHFASAYTQLGATASVTVTCQKVS